jgi:hypothetical protein
MSGFGGFGGFGQQQQQQQQGSGFGGGFGSTSNPSTGRSYFLVPPAVIVPGVSSALEDLGHQREPTAYSNLLSSAQALVLQAHPVSDPRVQLEVDYSVVVEHLGALVALEVRRPCFDALVHSAGLGFPCGVSDPYFSCLHGLAPFIPFSESSQI